MLSAKQVVQANVDTQGGSVKMLVPFEKFCIRPKREPYESMVGYIYRFLSVNGHRATVGGYHSYICRIYAESPSRCSELSEALGRAVGEVGYFNSRFWEERSLFFKEGVYGFTMRFPTLRARRVWYCCECMKAHPIHRAYWAFSSALTCPIHREWLHSACSVCGQALYWAGLKEGWHCSKGHRIYDGSSTTGKKRLVKRDEIFSLHPYFGSNVVPEYLSGHVDKVAIHEVQAAYLLSVGWANETERRKLADLGWGIERLAVTKWAVGAEELLKHITRSLKDKPPLTYRFIRWFYLWCLVMLPRSCHIKHHVSIVSHTVMDSLLNSVNVQRKVMARESIRLLDEHRIARIRNVVLHFDVGLPLNIGKSALRQFDSWWERVHRGVYDGGMIRRCSSKPRERSDGKDLTPGSSTKSIWTSRVLNLLVFSACMGFDAAQLKRFWSSVHLPRVQGQAGRRPAHKVLIAHLAQCSVTEVRLWNDLLEECLEMQRRRLCEHLRE